jgi:hypothetical protein
MSSSSCCGAARRRTCCSGPIVLQSAPTCCTSVSSSDVAPQTLTFTSGSASGTAVSLAPAVRLGVRCTAGVAVEFSGDFTQTDDNDITLDVSLVFYNATMPTATTTSAVPVRVTLPSADGPAITVPVSVSLNVPLGAGTYVWYVSVAKVGTGAGTGGSVDVKGTLNVAARQPV